MNTPTYKILIIEPSQETQKLLSEILKANNYNIKIVNNADDGILQAIRSNFDLIICQNELSGYSGFQVFKTLENNLLKCGTSFFLLFNKFENEDLFIGLEMGIENFIVDTTNKFSILHKIENQFKKIRKLDVFGGDKFKNYFHASPTAMFQAENHKIVETNESFNELFPSNLGSGEELLLFHEVFDINRNSKNKMNLRKLENGLIKHCFLENVIHKTNPSIICNISICNYNSSGNGRTFAEVVPTIKNTQIKVKQDHFCPQNGICLKHVVNSSERNTNSIELTNRENEIFELSEKGIPIKQIASKLHLSERTVEKHRSNIMRKANVHSMIEATLKVNEHRVLHSMKR